MLLERCKIGIMELVGTFNHESVPKSDRLVLDVYISIDTNNPSMKTESYHAY
jgi:hypothetical protein